jgi:hypothetical protein
LQDLDSFVDDFRANAIPREDRDSWRHFGILPLGLPL